MRHGHDRGHTHGLVDPSLARSRAGVRVVAVSLLVLAATAVLQAAVYAGTGSVALLADLVHNAGDALTALPLAAAFLLRSWTVERWAGFLVVLAILVSAVVSGVVAVDRLLDPRDVDHLWVLAAAGLIGFAGNEAAAVIRLRGGRRLASAALVADGHHARIPQRGADKRKRALEAAARECQATTCGFAAGPARRPGPGTYAAGSSSTSARTPRTPETSSRRTTASDGR
jgi:hypothetical protein